MVARLGRRRNRRRRVGTSALRRLALGAVAIAVAVGARWVWEPMAAAVRAHPYFTLERVVVRGAARLGPDVVREIAGVVPGGSVWDVDGEAAAERLRATPWIRAARVRRELPDRVVIAIREERPIAILAVRGGGLYYVSARGTVFAPLGPDDSRDLPYVTGLDAEELEGPDGLGVRAMGRALGLLRAAAGLGTISEVHVDRARGLVLYPVAPRFPIEIGWVDYRTRLARLAVVLAEWTGREDEIAGVSLLIDDQVIVRRHPVAGA